MPRIRNEYLNCAIYLYGSKAEADSGSEFGGSGFLAGYVSPDGHIRHLYAVTNAHVIKDGFTVIALNTKAGERDVFEITKSSWIMHGEDDVAVCPIEVSISHHDYNFVRADRFLTEADIDKHYIGPGDEVFMVGRLTGHQGTKKNLPIIRFGHLSMLPIEPLENPIRKQRAHFLVEVRSVSGFSGSPVIVFDLPYSIQGTRPEHFQEFLLGIDCGHMPKDEKLMKAGIAAVVPAWRLTELLERQELVTDRRERERVKAEEKAGKHRIVGDSAKPELTQNDFGPGLKKNIRKIESE